MHPERPATSSLIRRWVAVAALCLVAAGCLPQTENSIVDPASPADERLIGTWINRGEDYVEVLDISRPEAGGEGHLSAVLVAFGSAGQDPDTMTTRFDVRFTAIGDGTWFEAEPCGPDPFPDADYAYKRFFGRYTVDGDTLRVRFPDETPLLDAISGGALDGEAGDEGDFDSIRLTGSAAQIRAWLQTSATFDEGVAATYRRAAPR